MKKLIGILAACLFALPLVSAAQATNVAYSGVSLFTAASSTVTSTVGPVKLPTFSGAGVLTVTESGVTGSPSGCNIKLYYQGNNSPTATSVVATVNFTPGNNVQTFTIVPSVLNGDAYVAIYACSTTYPTAGLLTASFSPSAGNVSAAISGTASVNQVNVANNNDPCAAPSALKSNIAINISTATTTQLVAAVASKVVYVCGWSGSAAGTTPAITFEYGTGASCGTGTTALTGAMLVPSGNFVSVGGGGSTTFPNAAGTALCLVSGGTGPSIQGQLTYVQQ